MKGFYGGRSSFTTSAEVKSLFPSLPRPARPSSVFAKHIALRLELISPHASRSSGTFSVGTSESRRGDDVPRETDGGDCNTQPAGSDPITVGNGGCAIQGRPWKRWRIVLRVLSTGLEGEQPATVDTSGGRHERIVPGSRTVMPTRTVSRDLAAVQRKIVDDVSEGAPRTNRFSGSLAAGRSAPLGRNSFLYIMGSPPGLLDCPTRIGNFS